MTIIVFQGSFLGIDWNAVSALATVILVIGAVVELNLLRRDAKAARKPIIGVQRAVIDREGRLRVWLQNQGTGPATDIRLRFWVTSANGYLRGPDLLAAGRSWPEEDLDPNAQSLLPAIGAGQADVMYYVGQFPDVAKGKGWGLLAYDFVVKDIHGRTQRASAILRLARKVGLSKSRPRPGHISVMPEWDPEFSGQPLDPRIWD